MRLSQRDAAAIIASLDRIDEERQRILDMLLPDTDDEEGEPACPHPDDQIEDRSTLGDESYHCRACGVDLSQHPRTTTPQE